MENSDTLWQHLTREKPQGEGEENKIPQYFILNPNVARHVWFYIICDKLSERIDIKFYKRHVRIYQKCFSADMEIS